MFISLQYINEITIKFQCKCFKSKVVRVDGFRWKFKSIHKDFQHRIDAVRVESITKSSSYIFLYHKAKVSEIFFIVF